MDALLTKGAVDLIIAGREVKEPVFKVLGHKNVPGGAGGQNRYRLLLSDGEKTHSFCMLATQMNHLVDEGKLTVDSYIRVNKFVCNNVQGSKTVFIVLELEVLSPSALKPASSEVAGPSNPPARPPFNENSKTNGQHSPVKSSSFPTGLSNASPKTPRVIPKSLSTNSPSTPGGSKANVFPISTLNPYQNRWTVRGRVSQKGPLRKWSNARGEGKLFSFVLTDESSDIRVTAFKDEADKFNDLVQVGKVYYVSRGTLKTANPQWNNTKNEYEMTLNHDSTITQCDDGDEEGVPKSVFKFIQIGSLDSVAPNDFVDVVGIVHEVSEVTTITTRTTQRELQKRELTLVDDSRCQVRLTLWGEEALNFPTSGKPVIVGKGLKVSDFNGRSLSTTMNGTTLLLSPTNIPEAVRLRGWYEQEGQSLSFDSYRSEGGAGGRGDSGSTAVKSLAELKEGGIGSGDKPDYMSVVGTVIALKRENCMYQACNNEGCNKKVVDLNNGLYRCEKCNMESPNFKWRLMLQVNIADHSDNQWVSCFQENAENILGATAHDLGNMRELQQTSEFDAVFQEANFKTFNFRLRAKMETYNDETRLKVTVVEAKPVNLSAYAIQLATDIHRILDELK